MLQHQINPKKIIAQKQSQKNFLANLKTQNNSLKNYMEERNNKTKENKKSLPM
jgi:hypothetical protein